MPRPPGQPSALHVPDPVDTPSSLKHFLGRVTHLPLFPLLPAIDSCLFAGSFSLPQTLNLQQPGLSPWALLLSAPVLSRMPAAGGDFILH